MRVKRSLMERFASRRSTHRAGVAAFVENSEGLPADVADITSERLKNGPGVALKFSAHVSACPPSNPATWRSVLRSG